VTILHLVLLFMLAAAIVSILAERLRFPYTLALVITGLAVGTLHLFPPIHVTSEALVVFLIVPLLFEGSLRLPPAELRTYGWLIGLLAIPGTLIVALAIGGMVAMLWGLPVRTALLLGTIAAAIDPVSVIALIHETRLDSRLGTILEGEAVVNDGVAIVLFTIVMGMGASGFFGGARQFIWLLGAGGLVGVGLGVVISYTIGQIRLPQVEALGSLILAIAAFVLAETLGASGVIAVVVAGIAFGSYGLQNLTKEAQEVHRSIWDFIAFLANSVLFLLIGLEVPGELLLHHAGLIAIVVLTALAVRAITVYLFSAVHTRTLVAVPMEWRHVLIWGGLRGGVAIALILNLPADLLGRDAVAAAVFGLVIFTLLAQGLSIRPMIRWVGLMRET